MTSHIAILPSDVLDTISAKLDDQTRFLRLPHPRTGVASLFLPSWKDVQGEKRATILEVHAITPPNERSWFLNEEQVIEDGKLLVMTPIDPVFLLIPILQSAYPESETTTTFRPADDIFEQAIDALIKQAATAIAKDPSSTLTSKDLFTFTSMDFIPCAMKQICEVKEITPEIVVYKYSSTALVEYLRGKVSRLTASDAFRNSRTVVRSLAKNGLMEDGKEDLLSSGRTKAACDLLSQHLPPNIKAALTTTYDFSVLDDYMKSLQDELAALKVVDTKKIKKQNSKLTAETDKKRKPVKESHGVTKLKRVNTEGMSKISNFFQKPK